MYQTLINAISNLIAGFSSLAFQVGITFFVARFGVLHDMAYVALSLSISSFAPHFTLSLNTAVAKAIISCQKNGANSTEGIYFSGQKVARRYFCVFILVVLLLLLVLPTFYPDQISTFPSIDSLGVAAIFFGGGWLVLSQPAIGVLLAYQKNIDVAKVVIASRISSIVALASTLVLFGSIQIALIFAGLFQWIGYYLMNRCKIVMELKNKCVNGDSKKDVVVNMLGTTHHEFVVYSITTLVFQASIIPLIGLIDNSMMTNAYLVIMIFSIVGGVVFASSNAMIAPFGLADETEAADRYFKYGTIIYAMIITSMFFVFMFLPEMLDAWVGRSGYDEKMIWKFFYLLGPLQLVRLTAAPAIVFLVANARLRLITVPSVFELCYIMCIAIPLGFLYGIDLMLINFVLLSVVSSTFYVFSVLKLNGKKFNIKNRLMLIMPSSILVWFFLIFMREYIYF